MDATRAEYSFLLSAVEVAIKAGATTINIPDTVGYFTPKEYYELMFRLTKNFPHICFSVHCHNDLGLATANSLAGILGGAGQVECTINGIGERAGNAALEEVVMAMKLRSDLFKYNNRIHSQNLFKLSSLVAKTIGFTVPKNKAIIGENAFSHESGIHQDGMFKNPLTYQIISPKLVGVDQLGLVLGKHSGKAALVNKIKELGLKISPRKITSVFIKFKNLCDKKRS